jgi:hypothetical protein
MDFVHRYWQRNDRPCSISESLRRWPLHTPRWLLSEKNNRTMIEMILPLASHFPLRSDHSMSRNAWPLSRMKCCVCNPPGNKNTTARLSLPPEDEQRNKLEHHVIYQFPSNVDHGDRCNSWPPAYWSCDANEDDKLANRSRRSRHKNRYKNLLDRVQAQSG